MQRKQEENRLRTLCAGVLVCFVFFAAHASAQDSAAKAAQTASPELVGQLTKALSVTPAQASGGAGALFGLAKSKLNPADFGKVAAVVPGIDALIKSAPASSATKSVPGLSSLGGVGGLASVAGSFQKLGLSPEMAAKFAPVLVKFVEAKGGSGVASLLAGALR